MPRASIEALISALKKGETRASRFHNGGDQHIVTTLPARPAVTVISITLPSPRDLVGRYDALSPRDQELLAARTVRCRDLAARFVAELGAVAIECPKAQKAAS